MSVMNSSAPVWHFADWLDISENIPLKEEIMNLQIDCVSRSLLNGLILYIPTHYYVSTTSRTFLAPLKSYIISNNWTTKLGELTNIWKRKHLYISIPYLMR